MNTEVLQQFLVKLGFETDEKSLKSFIGNLETSALRITAFGAAITAMAGSVLKSLDDISHEYKQLDLLAKQFHSTAEEINNFIEVNATLGIKTQDSIDSLKGLGRAIADTNLGVGRAKKIFENLKIDVKGKGAIEVLDELKTKMANLDMGAKQRIMERLGLDPKLLVVFNDVFGKTAYIKNELTKVDLSTGFNLDKVVENSKNFQKSMKELDIQTNLTKGAFEKVYKVVAADIMPKVGASISNVAKVIEDVRRNFLDNAKKIEESLKPVLEITLKIGEAFIKLFVTAIKTGMDMIKPIIDGLMALNKATGGWALGIAAALAAWRVFNLGFLFTPLGAILALGVGLLALWDDFTTFQEGGESFINWTGTLGTVLKTVGVTIASVGAAFAAYKIGLMAYTVGTSIASAATAAFNILFRATPFGWAVLAIGAVIAIWQNWTSIIYSSKGVLKSFGDYLSGVALKLKAMTGIDLSALATTFIATFTKIKDMALKPIMTAIDYILGAFEKLTGFKFGDIGSAIGKAFGVNIENNAAPAKPQNQTTNTKLQNQTTNTKLHNNQITNTKLQNQITNTKLQNQITNTKLLNQITNTKLLNQITNTKLAPTYAANTQTLNANTVINVNGADNPQAVAQLVQSGQINANAQTLRNQQGRVR